MTHNGKDYSEEKYVDGCWVVKFSDFKQIRKPITIKDVIFKPTRRLAFIEGFLLGALLIGGSMIIKSHFCNGNKPQDPTAYTDTVTTPDPVVSDETTDDDIRSLLNRSDSILQKKDLSFAEVDGIYDEYNLKDIDRCKEIDSDICKRIEDYKNITDYIRNKN